MHPGLEKLSPQDYTAILFLAFCLPFIIYLFYTAIFVSIIRLYHICNFITHILNTAIIPDSQINIIGTQTTLTRMSILNNILLFSDYIYNNSTSIANENSFVVKTDISNNYSSARVFVNKHFCIFNPNCRVYTTTHFRSK